MKRFFFIFLCSLVPYHFYAQSNDLVETILSHNTTLRTIQAEAKAQQMLSRTDSHLPDPTVDVDYMFGTPNGIPNRTNFSISQQLDWGVLTGKRKRMVQSEDKMALSNVWIERQEILSQIFQALTQAIFYNQLCREQTERLKLAEKLQRLYEERYSKGDVNQIEVNKVRLNTSVARTELGQAENEREKIRRDLQKLNGGYAIVCEDTLYASYIFPPLSEIETIISTRHPQMVYAEAAIEQSEQQISLAKSMAWPTLTVGFTGEYIKNNNYSGPSIGFSLPLWGNTRSKVRQSKAENCARKFAYEDMRTQLIVEVRTLYASALSLQKNAAALRKEISANNNRILLQRSLEEGQINLLDYLLEISFYYTARSTYLEAERNAQLAIGRLRSYLYE